MMARNVPTPFDQWILFPVSNETYKHVLEPFPSLPLAFRSKHQRRPRRRGLLEPYLASAVSAAMMTTVGATGFLRRCWAQQWCAGAAVQQHLLSVCGVPRGGGVVRCVQLRLLPGLMQDQQGGSRVQGERSLA